MTGKLDVDGDLPVHCPHCGAPSTPLHAVAHLNTHSFGDGTAPHAARLLLPALDPPPAARWRAWLGRLAPPGLAIVALVSAALVLLLDTDPRLAPASVHRLVSALPLLLIAAAVIVDQAARQPGVAELARRWY